MKEKKTEVITFRTETWVKNLLEEAANQNKWSIAQTVNELCKRFVANPHPEKITVKAKELKDLINREIQDYELDKAIEIYIDLRTNEEETQIIKTLNFNVIECGGRGCSTILDNIDEISEEELLEIP